MTIIRTTCPNCGDIEVPAWAVSVNLIDLAEGSMVFTCPECQCEGSVEADAAAIALLSAAGVHVARGSELPPALTEVDVEAACAFLDSVDELCAHERLLG